jgi:hypothetical protein
MILSAQAVDCLVTTEKDWARIENLGVHEDKLCILTVGFELLSGKNDFFDMVKQRFKAFTDSTRE